MNLEKVPRISCEELKLAREKGEGTAIVDTRDRSSYDKSHIAGAVNIYYDPAADPLEREILLSGLPPDKLLVIYCD